MRLVDPTDFEILAALAETGRNNAANLAHVLDRDRSYINTRLPVLTDYGLLNRVGPAPNSGLYEITDAGRRAVEHQDLYKDDEDAFDAAVAGE